MRIFVIFGEHFPLTFVHQNVHCLHDERGRRTRRGNGPLKAETGRRKPIPSGREQSNAYRQVERTNEAKNGVGEVQRLGNVAQWAERQTHNLRVSGSNPGIPSIQNGVPIQKAKDKVPFGGMVREKAS